MPESSQRVLLMHALTYTREPVRVFAEIARVLRSGGRLLAVTLQRHLHEKAVEPYNHVNLGFTERELEKLTRQAGLEVRNCTVSAVEKRVPNFSVLSGSVPLSESDSPHGWPGWWGYRSWVTGCPRRPSGHDLPHLPIPPEAGFRLEAGKNRRRPGRGLFQQP